MGTMSVNPLARNPFESARWGTTPKIQEKANQTVKRAMTDGFVKQVQEQAKRDAKTGDYMTSTYRQMQNAQMKSCVSPDRSGPVAQTSAMIQDAVREAVDGMDRLLDALFGQYSAKVHVSAVGQTAEVYSPDGEIIADYNSLGGGWHMRQTKAESKFMSEAAAVYAKAFREARAEQKAARNPVPEGGADGVDVRV